ncbi:MAG: MerR family transcriptional regulator [Rhizobiales bacterium]|nr:MerR family transcriptional regulator [Hyphomicrobiales bacterium]
MDKAPEAFRTISEVAEDLDLPQHVLRFWETRFTQIKPLKRGGGRRYYRPGDVDLLKGIRTLLYGEGYTIRGVQRILREEGNGYVSSVGRGETEARKRDLELDGVPKPGAARPAPRITKRAPAVGAAPFARHAPAEADARNTGEDERAGLADNQVESLRLALAELETARNLLSPEEEN